MMLAGFAAREALHVAAYAHLIETLGMPESTYNEFLEYEAMADKHDYFMDLSARMGRKRVLLPTSQLSVLSLKVCSCLVRSLCC